MNEHQWQPDSASDTTRETCANCGQRRRRVAWGYVVRVEVRGVDRQVAVKDGEPETPCSPFVVIV